MKKYFDNLTEALQNFLIEVGELSYFAGRFFKEFWKPPYEFKELLRQCFYIGNRSLLLVSVTGFIIGLVFTLQSRPTLQEFGAVSWMASMVSVSIIREIGPIITALICAGRIGSGIGAELGSMKVTEQIDAMEVSGTKPLGFVVATRVLATTLLVPLLVIVGDAFSFLGSIVALNMDENVTFRAFMNSAFDTIHFSDLIPATIKTIFFGFFIGLIGSFKGYQASQSTEAVGLAANSAVITASLTIFVIDLLAVLVTNFIVSN